MNLGSYGDNNDIICDINSYAKGIGYRKSTMLKLIADWNSKHRNIKIATPDNEWVILTHVHKAIPLRETSIKRITNKIERHDKLLRLIPWNSIFAMACISSNKWTPKE